MKLKRDDAMFTTEETETLQEAMEIGYIGGVDIAIRAAEKGLVAILPKANELFIDIDTEDDFRTFRYHLAILEERLLDHLDVEVLPSNSGLPHRHIIVQMPFDMTQDQRIGFQAAIGSDRKRELLSLCESANGNARSVTLFEHADSPFIKDREVAAIPEKQPAPEPLTSDIMAELPPFVFI